MGDQFSGKNITVLGLGRSGSSAAEYLIQRGAHVLVSEQANAQPDKMEEIAALRSLGIEVETGGHSERAVTSADLILVSPGIPPTSDVIRRAQSAGKEIICDIELASRQADFSDNKVPIIGITGTNGKSTTCALISFMLESAGLSAPSCGNFGIPILDQLETKPDFLVAEISSYQLHYCTTLAPLVAVWLNLTPDHIEWHGSMEGYVEDKKKLFAHQHAKQHAVLNLDDPVVATILPASQVFPFSIEKNQDTSVQAAYMSGDFLCYRIDGISHTVCHKNDLKIIGKHNLENALAAVSVGAILRLPHEKIADAIVSFTALEHRLEFVATVNGVDFYNDSKATNPASTIKALQAFYPAKVVLIAGGRDKGTSLSELVQSIKEQVSSVILLGEAKQRFSEALQEAGFNEIYCVDSLEDAIELGRSLKQGPVVLSPACASFDMFKNYEDRGRAFKNLVCTRVEKVAPSH